MEAIERAAFTSVLRACGFASLAIMCVMVGLSFDLRAAFQAGGVLTLLLCLVLALKAWHSSSRPYKRTELWLLLDPAERPQPAVAQQLIGGALREVYLRFALHAAYSSTGMLAAATLVGFLPGRA